MVNSLNKRKVSKTKDHVLTFGKKCHSGCCGSVDWNAVPYTTGPQVLFLVRAHTWVLGSIPSWRAYERQPIDVSLSHPCLSLSLSSPPSLPKK